MDGNDIARILSVSGGAAGVARLGAWKLLGAIALLVPGLTRLKEWAYAGIFFNMTGAMVSHAVCGDNVRHIVAPGAEPDGRSADGGGSKGVGSR